MTTPNTQRPTHVILNRPGQLKVHMPKKLIPDREGRVPCIHVDTGNWMLINVRYLKEIK